MGKRGGAEQGEEKGSKVEGKGGEKGRRVAGEKGEEASMGRRTGAGEGGAEGAGSRLRRRCRVASDLAVGRRRAGQREEQGKEVRGGEQGRK